MNHPVVFAYLLTSICSSPALASHYCVSAIIKHNQTSVFHLNIFFDDRWYFLSLHLLVSVSHQNSVNGFHKDYRVGCSNPGEHC